MSDSLQNIISGLAHSLDVAIQEGETTAEISKEVLTEFLKPQNPVSEPPRKPAGTGIVSAPADSAVYSSRPARPADSAVRKENETLPDIAAEIAECRRCLLCKTRKNSVPGTGCLNPDVMFIGEAPGADEDAQGEPFVGRAGQLLNDMIRAMGFSRESVYIANIIKCRPPDNRTPALDETAACIGFLKRQIAVIKPKTIVALGAVAVHGLLNNERGITGMRGKWFAFEGIPLMPTFHPAYLLRFPAAKRDAWSDLKEVLKRIGRTPPQVVKKAQNNA